MQIQPAFNSNWPFGLPWWCLVSLGCFLETICYNLAGSCCLVRCILIKFRWWGKKTHCFFLCPPNCKFSQLLLCACCVPNMEWNLDSTLVVLLSLAAAGAVEGATPAVGAAVERTVEVEVWVSLLLSPLHPHPMCIQVNRSLYPPSFLLSLSYWVPVGSLDL